MNNGPLVTSMLAEVERTGLKSSLRDRIVADRASLMQSVDVPTTVLEALVAHSGDDWPPAAQVLELLIDDARMDAENEGAFGARFLSSLESAISKLIEEGQLTSVAGSLLARCYGRANVPVPERLVSFHLAQMEECVDRSRTLPPDFDQAVASMAREADGDVYVLYEGLRETTAGLPPEMKAALVYELSSRDQAFSATIATYSLLDGAAPVREAAALALLHRAKQGKCDGVVVRRLPMLRSWMPADPARAVVDEVIRHVRRRNLSASSSGPAANAKQIHATIPDGAGGQSFAIVARGKLGLILTKIGYGVKDAYVIECRTDREVREILDQFREVHALDVTLETVGLALSAGLAEGLAHDLPPAHGLVDVAGVFGLEAVRPQRMAPADWLQVLDPEDRISALSTQKRGALVNQSRQWSQHYPITETWFEDNPETRELLDSTADRTRQEKLIWSYLESRREFWALRILQGGLVVKGAGGEWLSHGATAAALLDGRPLAKIPVMRQIVENTVDAFDYHDQGTEAAVEIHFDEPASAEEVSAVLAEVGMVETAPSWLDGYLTAVVIAPKVPDPNEWVGGLMEGTSGPVSQEAAQSLLHAVISRYNEIGVTLSEQGKATGITQFTDKDLGVWARGFTYGVGMISGSWKARLLKKDDNNLLDLIGQVAAGNQLGFDPRSIVENWVVARFGKRG
jgi:yecA family protein